MQQSLGNEPLASHAYISSHANKHHVLSELFHSKAAMGYPMHLHHTVERHADHESLGGQLNTWLTCMTYSTKKPSPGSTLMDMLWPLSDMLSRSSVAAPRSLLLLLLHDCRISDNSALAYERRSKKVHM